MIFQNYESRENFKTYSIATHLVSPAAAVVVHHVGSGSGGAAPGVHVGTAPAPAQRSSIIRTCTNAPEAQGSMVVVSRNTFVIGHIFDRVYDRLK